MNEKDFEKDDVHFAFLRGSHGGLLHALGARRGAAGASRGAAAAACGAVDPSALGRAGARPDLAGDPLRRLSTVDFFFHGLLF